MSTDAAKRPQGPRRPRQRVNQREVSRVAGASAVDMQNAEQGDLPMEGEVGYDLGKLLASRLRPWHIVFAQGVATGLTLAEAYREARGRHIKDTTARINGSMAKRKPHIAAYIAYLQDKARVAGEAVVVRKSLTRERKREILHTVAERHDDNQDAAVALRAIQIDNAMTGDDAPIKIEGGIAAILAVLSDTTGLPQNERSTRP